MSAHTNGQHDNSVESFAVGPRKRMIRRSCRVAHSCGHSCASWRSVRLARGDLVSLGFEAGPPNDLLFGEPSKEQIPLGAFPQLVREQSEHGEAVLSGYVDLAVCL